VIYKVKARYNGRGYCGCMIKHGEEYFIKETRREFLSICSKCFKKEEGDVVHNLPTNEVKNLGRKKHEAVQSKV